MKCACWAGYTGSACDIATPAPNANSMVGTNMGGVNYYSSEWAFVDAMIGSSDWVSNYAADWLVQQVRMKQIEMLLHDLIQFLRLHGVKGRR
jgi:hypothetical protein